jgi:hypothetical protein
MEFDKILAIVTCASGFINCCLALICLNVVKKYNYDTVVFNHKYKNINSVICLSSAVISVVTCISSLLNKYHIILLIAMLIMVILNCITSCVTMSKIYSNRK